MAWPRRPEDELKLAEALGNVKALGVIHDRRVPGSKEYPDHIAVDLLSRFVIDAKRRTTAASKEGEQPQVS